MIDLKVYNRLKVERFSVKSGEIWCQRWRDLVFCENELLTYSNNVSTFCHGKTGIPGRQIKCPDRGHAQHESPGTTIPGLCCLPTSP